MAKIAGVEVETKVSLTGVIAMFMALAALFGGWYKFDYRISALEQDHEMEMQIHSKLNDTLNEQNSTMQNLNTTVMQLKQRLDDAHIGAN